MGRAYLQGTYLWNFTVVVLNSLSENWAYFQIDCLYICQNVAALWIVSWEFSLISVDSSTRKQVYFKVPVHELLWSCVLRTISFFSFVTLQQQRYLELSYLPYLSDRKCLILFLENY